MSATAPFLRRVPVLCVATLLVLGGLAPAAARADTTSAPVATVTAANHDLVVFSKDCAPQTTGGGRPGTGARFFVTSSDDASDQHLVATGPHGSAVAPTLDRVAFARGAADETEIVVTDAHGGNEQVVATLAADGNARVYQWSDDASTLLVSDAGLLYAVAATADAVPQPLLTPDQAAQLELTVPRFVPGKNDSAVAVSTAHDNFDGIYVVSVGSEPTALAKGFEHWSSYATTFASVALGSEPSTYLLAYLSRFDWGILQESPTGSSTVLDLPQLNGYPEIEQAIYSSDGRWAYYVAIGPQAYRALYRVPLDRSTRPELLLETLDDCLVLVTTLPGSPLDGAAPRRLTVTLDGTANLLSWQAPSAAGAVRYRIDRFDGENPDSTAARTVYTGAATTFRDAVVVGGTYTYALTVVDSAGHAHGPVRAVAVATAPTLTAPALSSDTSVNGRFTLRWGTAQNAPDTVYLHSPTNFAEWWLPITSETVERRLPGTSSYVVRAADRFDNVSVPSRATIVTPVDERAGRFSAGWRQSAAGSSWHRTLTTTATTGATASFSFVTTDRAAHGRSIWLVGMRGPGRGKLAIYLDGRRVGVVDSRASRLHPRSHLWVGRGWAAPGRHTLRVVALGTAGRPTVSIDAVGAAA